MLFRRIREKRPHRFEFFRSDPFDSLEISGYLEATSLCPFNNNGVREFFANTGQKSQFDGRGGVWIDLKAVRATSVFVERLRSRRLPAEKRKAYEQKHGQRSLVAETKSRRLHTVKCTV